MKVKDLFVSMITVMHTFFFCNTISSHRPSIFKGNVLNSHVFSLCVGTWSQVVFPSCPSWCPWLLLFLRLKPLWSWSACSSAWWSCPWSWSWSWSWSCSSGPRFRVLMRASRSAEHKYNQRLSKTTPGFKWFSRRRVDNMTNFSFCYLLLERKQPRGVLINKKFIITHIYVADWLIFADKDVKICTNVYDKIIIARALQ